MRILIGFLTFALLLQAQEAAQMLNIVIVEGEGAINNIRQRTAREPIVQVEDENHRPVAGASVVFLLPNSGPSGTFAGGAHTLTAITDAQGRAVAQGLRLNRVSGNMQIRVTATSQGKTSSAVISQTNVAGAAAGAAGAAGISLKLITILIVAGAATAGGITAGVLAAGGGRAPTTITPGAGTVTAPR